jgi:hypothetical protein
MVENSKMLQINKLQCKLVFNFPGMKTALLHNLSIGNLDESDTVQGNCEPDGSSLILDMRRFFEPMEDLKLRSDLRAVLEKYSLVDADGIVSMPTINSAGEELLK